MKCAGCGEENRDEANFCIECGNELKNESFKPGQKDPATAKFCFNCGSRLMALPHTESGASQSISSRFSEKGSEVIRPIPQSFHNRTDQTKASINKNMVEPSSERLGAAQPISAKAKELKRELEKTAGATYSKLLDKSQVLRNAIQSGEYKKILDNEFVKTALSWFRVSDARLRIPIYIGWSCFVYFLMGVCFGSGGSAQFISKTLESIQLGVVMGLYVYALGAASGPLHKILNIVNKWQWGWIVTFPFFTLPWFVCGWPAEKLYSWLFYKYTCLSMGILYLRQRAFDKALYELERAKAAKGDTDAKFMLYASLGDVYTELDRFDEAIGAYSKATEVDPGDVSVKTDLAYCYMMKKQYNGALSLFREVLAASPEYINALLGMARCYLEMDMFEEAIPLLRQAIALEPQSATGHKMLAEAYAGLNDQGAALKEARLVLDLDPSSELADGAREIIDYIESTHVSSGKESSPRYCEDATESISPNWDQPPGDADYRVPPGPLAENRQDVRCANPSCRKIISKDAVFCGYCGTKVADHEKLC